MPRPIPVPRHLEQVPFGAAEAAAAGLSPTRLGRGDLDHPFFGVHRVGDEQDVGSLARAYAVTMGEAAFFCGPTAAELYGMPLPARVRDLPLHVGVPAPGRAPRARGVVGHKLVVGDGEVVEHDGLRVTSVIRTWCDLAPWLDLPHLVAVGDQLLHRDLAWVDPLAQLALRHPGRRGRSNRVRAVSMLDSRAESPPESVLRVHLHLAGLVGFVPNLDVTVDRYRYRLDLAWPERRVVLEYQGGYHHDPVQWRRDMTRRSRLESAGWIVIFVSSADLVDPAELVRRIRRIVDGRGR